MDPVQPNTIDDPSAVVWEQGRSIRQSGRPTEALRILRQAIATRANDYRLHDEMGMALADLDRQEEAIGSFLVALRLNPNFGEACNKIGSAFASRGMLEPAADWFLRARQINPATTKYLYSYGCVLTLLNKRTEAAAIFDEWLRADPENPIAHHLASAALGTQSLTKASPKYVRVLFDNSAKNFDQQLTKLKYCGPELAVCALLQVAEAPAGGWDILDAGCGTGLSGAALKPLARRLIGVDLSPGMLQLARQRAIYDDLIEGDIFSFLRDNTQAFDVVSATDVLTYIGDLNEFFSQVAFALRPSGLVVVATEALKSSDDYHLNPSGRFSHSETYLRQVMKNSGLTIEHFEGAVMRYESKKPVPSLVTVGRKSRN